MSGYQPIARIPVQAPSPSILTSARPLPEGTNWSTGVAWTPVSCHPSSAWPRCPSSAQLAAGKAAATGLDGAVHTDAFVIYTPLDCDWATQDDVDSAAVEVTDVHTARGIARAAWLGEGLPDVADQPSFRRSATDVSGGVTSALDDALALLLAAYNAATGGLGGGVLHVPTTLLPAALGGTGGGARIAWPEGNLYRGPGGVVVSPGPGYPDGLSATGVNGFGPISAEGPPTLYKGNGANEAWIYLTGPIEFAVGPVRAVSATPGVFRTNKIETLGERDAIVRFDPCSVFAVKTVNPAGVVS